MVSKNQSDAQKWIIRIGNSPTQGPFSTAEVIERINDGDLFGEEMVALFPDGQWKRLSQEPTFFSLILDVLEKGSQDFADKKRQTATEPNTEADQDLTVADDGTHSRKTSATSPTKTSDSILKSEDNNWQVRVDEYNAKIQLQKENKKKLSELAKETSSYQATIIEAQNLRNNGPPEHFNPESQKLQNWMYLVGAVVAVVAAYLIFFEVGPNADSHGFSRISLKAPQFGNKKLSDKEVQQLLKSSLQNIQADTLEGYLS
ncbi:MAG: hypothetical protein ACK5WZ_05845, partial [Pseudobdellovibrionaceae bacterium]